VAIGPRIQEINKKQTKRGRKTKRGEKKEVNCITNRQGGTKGRKERKGEQRTNYKQYEEYAHFVTPPHPFCKYIEGRNVWTTRIYHHRRP
jgi:hypothetical protein